MQLLAKKAATLLYLHQNYYKILIQSAAFSSAFKEQGLRDGYFPALVEKDEFECYKYFKSSRYNGQSFSMILPPPNITGNLHLGHALTATVQDVIVRWNLMNGTECLWTPGIDHAGIATQVMVEKLLWNEKRQTRHDIGRKAFEKIVWKWKEDKAAVIERQLNRLGASLTWSHKVFTMDVTQSLAVTKAFIKLFESGLIYRADHLVNWSCSLQSAISDIEVEHIDIDGPTLIPVPNYEKPIEFGTLTYFAYKLCDSDDEIIVATTRLETMLGDVAVAVNPKDTRYSSYIGQYLWHPFRKEKIPVISDKFVDPEFGTGAVKVTPAHDPADFSISKLHSLPLLSVIDEKGNITFGEFVGIPRFLVRDIILSRLETSGLVRDKRGHKMVVPICSRSKDVVEYLVKPQWFVKCERMAKEAMDDVREGRLNLEPKQFEKVWFDWLGNIRDWCISRQLWWGHRIPIYLCRPSSHPSFYIAAESLSQALTKASSRCPNTYIEIQQDSDVLDTWFSSALLPFTVWTQQESTKFYPLSMMETGHDILFFWVARMVMLGKKLTGRLPFEKVLLHGIVCDSHGRKMSKSLGNVVAPEDVIEGRTLEELEETTKRSHQSGIVSKEELELAVKGQKIMFPMGIPECGADALRFTLCSHNVKNHFINFDVQECHTNKLFCNKIWQATKYTNGVVERAFSEKWKLKEKIEIRELGVMDRWVLSKLSRMVEECGRGMENYDFHVVTAAIKEFLYFQFCDVYLETTKRAFKVSDVRCASGHCWTLTTCVDTALKVLAPFMPRLAQHLHTRLAVYPGQERKMEYPEAVKEWRDQRVEDDVEKVMEVVVGVRRMKKLFGVGAKHKPEAYVVGDFYTPFLSIISDLSALHSLTILPHVPLSPPANTISDRVATDTLIRLVVPPELRKSLELDLPKLETKKAKLVKELDKMNKMLAGDNYKVKAAEEAQRIHAKKIATLEEKLARINYIQSLSKQ